MLDKILKTITDQYGPLSSKTLVDVTSRCELVEGEKGNLLVKEGQYSDKLFYVVKGGVRAFYLKDGKTISDWFSFEGDFISSIIGFFLDVPSQHYIEPMEDSSLLVFKRDDIDFLCDKHHDFERLGRLSVTKTMLQLQQRVVAIQFKSSKERYDSLLQKYPKIELRVPLGDIASYLGITQETLSRIRNPKNGI